MSAAGRHDIAQLRARLARGGGPGFWKSLDALADTAAFRRFVQAEFPAASLLSAGPDRRAALKLMAASFALAGLTGCDDSSDDDPRDHEVPFVRNGSSQVDGRARFYASAALLDGFANGILVTTRSGRPVKIEGNNQHPWSRGGTDILAQASVLSLYDPSRSQSVRFRDRPSDWPAFVATLTGQMGVLRSAGGRGLHVLTGPITSPSVQAQIAALQHALPESRWYSHAPVDRSATYDGARLAFGRPLETRWRFDRANAIVSLDGDFLDLGPQQVGVSRDWIDARRSAAARGRLPVLYAAAATPNLTSAKADDAVVASPAALGALVARLAAAEPGDDPLGRWAKRAGDALRAGRGRGIVLTGLAQSAELHAAVHRLNALLGNLGQSVFHTVPALLQAPTLASLAEAMRRGEVQTLLMLDCNPVYTAPADLDFAALLPRVALKIHAGLEVDETAENADWHLPMAHPLEAWADARAFDGTVTLLQPTIAPLYNGRSLAEILSLLADAPPQAGQDLLQRHHAAGQDPVALAPRWQQALRDGFLPNTALPAEPVQLASTTGVAAASPARPAGVTVLFRPDPSVWDGAVANNAWLQELPKPLTKLVWANVVALAPALAERLHLAQGDIVEIAFGADRIEAPAWLLPGQADDTATVFLGYGRAAQEMLASGLGYDAYRLRKAASPWQREGATLRRTGRSATLATTQNHGTMEGHDFVQVRAVGAQPPAPSPEPPSLYPPWPDDGRAWGMVIDLDACIGCNACVVACQSENNIPVVGREEVAKGREMHWLRVDRYYAGDLDAPRTHFQPLPCMQCEQAPCEVGCPVEATLHDHEGLNLQVYNRCIGTRACSSYCPYKVRHFNYFDYAAAAPAEQSLQHNPDVTIRARGVMEKCTYCVQRIAAARIDSDRDGTPIADGTVVTACQSACPTRAIAFGDLNDAGAQVRAARHDARNYALLGELNTRPRTTYLARLAPDKQAG